MSGLASKKNLREYNRKLREINKALTLVRKQVREIHSQGPSFMNALEKRMEESMLVVKGIKKKISAAKAQSKKRKQEIDEWKLWYNGLAHINKTKELKQLNAEIRWRAKDIAAKEKEISKLYKELIIAEGVEEQIKVQIEAVRNFDFKGKIDDEIQVKTLLREKKKLQSRIAKLKAS